MDNFVLKIQKYFDEPINVHITSQDELAVVIGSLDVGYKILELKVLGHLNTVQEINGTVFKKIEPPEGMELGA